ncbi:unannotated protein [freshwater metagenome]|uniref:Unannotated protein n=1 Tax=freshwater metagenome TaxID=449393 RepID=A0A6J6VS11_9ZZZZ
MQSLRFGFQNARQSTINADEYQGQLIGAHGLRLLQAHWSKGVVGNRTDDVSLLFGNGHRLVNVGGVNVEGVTAAVKVSAIWHGQRRGHQTQLTCFGAGHAHHQFISRFQAIQRLRNGPVQASPGLLNKTKGGEKGLGCG